MEGGCSGLSGAFASERDGIGRGHWRTENEKDVDAYGGCYCVGLSEESWMALPLPLGFVSLLVYLPKICVLALARLHSMASYRIHLWSKQMCSAYSD